MDINRTGLNQYQIEDYNNLIKGQTETKKGTIKDSNDNQSIPSSRLDEIAAIYSPSQQVESLYNKDGVVISKAQVNKNNVYYQDLLGIMGFYNGPHDGNLSRCQTAIKNFQSVYGLNKSGALDQVTKSKLESACSTYEKILYSDAMNKLTQNEDFSYDSAQKSNFAGTWAFLKVGMGLSNNQICGIMGNMNFESRLSTDNAHDASHPGVHNSSYNFSVNDGIAYGLIQWLGTRKQGLADKAVEMGGSVSDLNVQLGYLRYELTEDTYYSRLWKTVKQNTSVDDTCYSFTNLIEGNTDAVETRKSHARTIKECFANY